MNTSDTRLTVITDRLILSPMTDNEMKNMVQEQTDAMMKQAYGEMLEGSLAHPAERQWYAVWVIRIRENGNAVGDLCFKGVSSDGATEIGYGLYNGYEGHGYMTEAVTAMVAWALRQVGVTCVEAETEPNNEASQRVLKRVGFIPTGTVGEEGPRFVYNGNTKTAG